MHFLFPTDTFKVSIIWRGCKKRINQIAYNAPSASKRLGLVLQGICTRDSGILPAPVLRTRAEHVGTLHTSELGSQTLEAKVLCNDGKSLFMH